MRTPPSVATVKRGGVTSAGVDGGLGQAADAIAAHFGLSAVGVAQLHGQVAAVAARADPDDPVGPDATAPVTEQANLADRQPQGVVGIEDDDEVVARSFVFGAVHPPVSQFRAASRAPPGPARAGRRGPPRARSR